jgi:hypothetical protein
MVAELTAKTIRATPELRLTEVLEEAISAPVLLESEGNVYRLSKEDPASEPTGAKRPGATTLTQGRDDRLAAIERIVGRRQAFFQGRALPDDSTDILRRERDERSRHVAGL